MSGPDLILPDWPVPARVRAAFTLRTGGVSQSPCDTFNVGARVADDPHAVAENRRRLRTSLQLPAEPAWLEQMHGCTVVDLDRQATHESLGPADASVTRALDRVCVIQVADCMPVLFAAADGSAVGAAHAGWRGLAGGVLEATVRALGTPPGELLAWMGPAIGQAHFEVGDEVRAAFLAVDSGASAAFIANERGRWQCDLYALARRRLAALGVVSIHGGGWCTYSGAERFFSYRRDGRCGRMAALVWRVS
ncbi:MAG TPA: peptidoglycan editing factor PgeF [Steroidobacteraceae bacterium]|nr:peptidoglycan editing factor PgeF [Steroidobacteraceae bacterium]